MSKGSALDERIAKALRRWRRRRRRTLWRVLFGSDASWRRHRSQCRNFNERNIKLASILMYMCVWVCGSISMWECVHGRTERFRGWYMSWGRGGHRDKTEAGIAHVIAINMFLPVVFPVFRHPFCRCRDDGETALYIKQSRVELTKFFRWNCRCSCCTCNSATRRRQRMTDVTGCPTPSLRGTCSSLFFLSSTGQAVVIVVVFSTLSLLCFCGASLSLSFSLCGLEFSL